VQPRPQPSSAILFIKEECVEDVPESSATFVQPRPHQCLHCHQDMESLHQLAGHMRESRHLNTSWAVQSNICSSSSRQQQAGPYTGRWYQKLDVTYKCSFCCRKAAHGMSTHRFGSIREVFLHILTIHLADFRVEYAATTVRFALCKLCNGFINLEEEGDEEGVVNRCANLLHPRM
jgi:hypothetical protein